MAEHRAADLPTLTALDAALDLPPFFAGFSPETLRTFLPSLALWRYIEGEPVVREGEEGSDFFVILQGSACVLKTTDGADREVAKLGPGDSFGEVGVLAGAPRSATIVAETDCLIASLNPRDLEKVFERQPQLAERLESQARQRLEESRRSA